MIFLINHDRLPIPRPLQCVGVHRGILMCIGNLIKIQFILYIIVLFFHRNVPEKKTCNKSISMYQIIPTLIGYIFKCASPRIPDLLKRGVTRALISVILQFYRI